MKNYETTFFKALCSQMNMKFTPENIDLYTGIYPENLTLVRETKNYWLLDVDNGDRCLRLVWKDPKKLDDMIAIEWDYDIDLNWFIELMQQPSI